MHVYMFTIDVNVKLLHSFKTSLLSSVNLNAGKSMFRAIIKGIWTGEEIDCFSIIKMIVLKQNWRKKAVQSFLDTIQHKFWKKYGFQ